MKTLALTNDFYWVGNLDPDLRIFDIIMETEFGTTYNSYILKGKDKNVLFESTKVKCFSDYLEKVESILPVTSIDYIVVNHTEPDHAGSIEKLLELHPGLKIVGTSTAINFLKEICNRDFTAVVVNDGDTLFLGNKTLRFLTAPNLHWPDTMFTYIEEDKTLVTCDCFGSHYSHEGITDEEIADQEGYMRALRYYFDMIIGPFKSFALAAIKKIEGLDIGMIATGHGPVLVKEPMKIVELYREWSTERNPNPRKTVVIPYVSAYGYTLEIAEKIAEGIRTAGDMDVRLYDLVVADTAKVMEELYWADGILLGTPTMVGDALKPVWDICTGMFAKTHGGKLASAFGSYGWSGEGVPNILQRLKQLKMKVYGDGLKIRFKPNAAQLQDSFEFGFNFGMSVLAGKIIEPTPEMKNIAWKCMICGEVVKGIAPPAACPVCGVGPEQFVKISAEETLFRSDKKERFVIVGNGAAGVMACEEIRRRNAAASIELISEEGVSGYNRPMLTKGILSEVDDLSLYMKPETWYEENRIIQTLGVKVASVDTAGKKLLFQDGGEREYDKLILATGASSAVPPMEGVGLPGVFSIRSLSDVQAIQKELKTVESVVVVGGGILGLEAAWEVKKAGKNVTVVQRSDMLMDRQVDEKGGRLLQAACEKEGVVLSLGKAPEAVVGNGKAEGLKLADGSVIPARMVIFSTGIKPNIDLAKAAGIGTDRFIIVNERMETSAAGVYACGDCAAYNGVSIGIWNQAVDQGKVAGANAAGEEMVYQPVTPSNAFSGMGTKLFSIGDPGKDPAKKYKSLELFDEAKGTYEKLYFLNGRFCGGVLLGDVAKATRLIEAFKKQEGMEKLL